MRIHLVPLLLLTLLTSDAHAQRQRCGTPEPSAGGSSRDVPSDCGYFTNTPKPEYEPSCTYEIPVVFHVIQDSSGEGFLSAATIQDQIDVLNEDLQAIAGTPGALGTNARIRLHLASTDPGGSPTTGITYSMDDSWYLDMGNYWDSLAWDTNRYLNIYTNAVPCCYGYVSGFPSQGIAGQTDDRIVVWWEAVGRNATSGWPLNMGRTTTHEVGHYLGLYHTFCGGCGSAAACDTTGDLICDTNGESSSTSGCPGSKSSCGNPDPIHNYMDYTDDPCMWEFTPEQVIRMRCTLENWRPDVFQMTQPVATYCTAGSTASGCTATLTASGASSASASSGFILQAANAEGAKDGLFFFGTSGRQASAWGNGSSYQCVVPPVRRAGLLAASGTSGQCDGSFSQDLNALWCPTCPLPLKNPGSGAVVQAQLWHRDPFNTSNQTTSLSNAVEFCVAP
jgi:hypothetical protein